MRKTDCSSQTVEYIIIWIHDSRYNYNHIIRQQKERNSFVNKIHIHTRIMSQVIRCSGAHEHDKMGDQNFECGAPFSHAHFRTEQSIYTTPRTFFTVVCCLYCSTFSFIFFWYPSLKLHLNTYRAHRVCHNILIKSNFLYGIGCDCAFRNRRCHIRTHKNNIHAVSRWCEWTMDRSHL